MDEEGDSGVGEEMVGFTGGRIGGHDDGWEWVKRGRGEVGIGHERDVGGEVFVACSEMELYIELGMFFLSFPPSFFSRSSHVQSASS